jgi:2-methylisocitrate lyase-like PEP mutase family enzyme
MDDPQRADSSSESNQFRDLRERFGALHANGLFVIPNAWDLGSARLLVHLGFAAIATTSSGHAASLGRPDQHVSRDELLSHVAAVVEAVDVPVSVDAEHGFGDDPAAVRTTFELLAATGAAGCSIEDYDPSTGRLEPVEVAAERVAAAAEATRAGGLVLTARAENHLYGADDLDDTITRLRTYRGAGADVVYAPGLATVDDIRRVVDEVGCPVNVLARPNGPTIAELASIGVRRVSTGGALAFAAYGALVAAGRELLEEGTSTYATRGLGDTDRAAFAAPATLVSRSRTDG